MKCATIMNFSEGELFGEVARCCRGDALWFWYRDVIAQAEKRGFLRIVGHSDDKPMWWRSFDEGVEVTSEKLAEVLRSEAGWKGNVVSV